VDAGGFCNHVYFVGVPVGEWCSLGVCFLVGGDDLDFLLGSALVDIDDFAYLVGGVAYRSRRSTRIIKKRKLRTRVLRVRRLQRRHNHMPTKVHDQMSRSRVKLLVKKKGRRNTENV
jgi:hypothetical protein